MTYRKARCKQCHCWFQPLRSTQQTCFHKKCQQERHRKNCRVWNKANPGNGPSNVKVRQWAAKTDYWKTYRKENETYRRREKRRMRLKRKREKTVAKRDLRTQVSLEKLQSIQDLSLTTVAKQDSRDRRVEEILGFLMWKETSQNKTQAQGSTI